MPAQSALSFSLSQGASAKRSWRALRILPEKRDEAQSILQDFTGFLDALWGSFTHYIYIYIYIYVYVCVCMCICMPVCIHVCSATKDRSDVCMVGAGRQASAPIMTNLLIICQ